MTMRDCEPRMTYGKFKGWKLSEVPFAYLKSLVRFIDIDGYLMDDVIIELSKRTGVHLEKRFVSRETYEAMQTRRSKQAAKTVAPTHSEASQ